MFSSDNLLFILMLFTTALYLWWVDYQTYLEIMP